MVAVVAVVVVAVVSSRSSLTGSSGLRRGGVVSSRSRDSCRIADIDVRIVEMGSCLCRRGCRFRCRALGLLLRETSSSGACSRRRIQARESELMLAVACFGGDGASTLEGGQNMVRFEEEGVLFVLSHVAPMRGSAGEYLSDFGWFPWSSSSLWHRP